MMNQILVGKPKGTVPLVRPWRRWNSDIKMDLGEIGLEGVNRIYLAQNRELWWALVNTVINLRVP
jgi:hypothetical protein